MVQLNEVNLYESPELADLTEILEQTNAITVSVNIEI